MTTPRRKACVECRQQKIRCDVEQLKTPHDPCSRCRKMNLECRILPTSTRNLRQTKAEMRRELEELRWNLRHGNPNDPTLVLAHGTPASQMSGDHQPFSPQDGTASYMSGPQTDESESMSPPHQSSASGPPTRKPSGGDVATMARSLDGYVVDPTKIAECFTLYFTHYHATLPILDPALSPNDYYHLSPFLFWTIIVTGSRRYLEDPTILDKTSQRITPLAFSSMALRSTPIPVIQGLLILCTWRLPTSSMYKDMTHVLCGAAVHLATQIGLHVTGIGQDFARMPLKKDQEQMMFRAKLWMHCVVCSIRSSCVEGIPPLVIAESFFEGDERERQDVLQHLPVELLFQHKIHTVLLQALSAMVRTELRSPNCDHRVLRSMVSIFDSQFVALASTSPSELDTLQLNCARLHVLCFHFFANPTDPGPDVEALTRLYSLCVSTLQMANRLSQTTNFISTCPSFIDRSLTLTGFAVLKLIRSPLAQHLDVPAGEQAYHYAAQFTNHLSMQKGDLAARTAAIMMNLWSSTKVFRRKDGSIESLGLRLRTRLSMSVSFDMFWYWREEFGNMSNPYNGEELSIVQTRQTTPQYEKREMVDQTRAPTTQQQQHPQQQQQQQIPVSKYPLDVVNSVPNAPVAIDFPAWDGDYNSIPPMLDQFPDYDWAASLDFANEWPNPVLAPLAPGNVGYAPGPMTFG